MQKKNKNKLFNNIYFILKLVNKHIYNTQEQQSHNSKQQQQCKQLELTQYWLYLTIFKAKLFEIFVLNSIKAFDFLIIFES